jgi:hypothetical protein
MISGQIEHCDQLDLRMNASFGHGTLQLGTYRVYGEMQISRNPRRSMALCEPLNDTDFGICEFPGARRSESFTALA